jgi:glycosyltransferase involved in cell wall biosynthesis
MLSKPFNILYFSSFGSLRGGGQKSLYYLVTNLDRTAFRPHVVIPTEDSLAAKLRAHDIAVIVLGLPKILNINILKHVNALQKLLRLCTEYDIDLIHTDGPRNTFYAGLAAKIKHIPLAWHVRASNRDSYDRLLYYLSTKIILVADTLRSRFDWANKSRKFITVYNAVDLTDFRPGKSSKVVRNQYKISNSGLIITVTGRIEKLKGQKYLIEACGMLKEKLENFYVLLSGEIAELSYMKECEDKAVEFGIQDRIIFTGYRDDVSQILGETDIFVLPSLFEAFPRSVIEAMSSGKPVIVTDVGGCREAVEDDVSGFVVPPGKSEALADRIHMLGTDDKRRLEIGRAARTRAEGMFGIKQNVEKIQQVYMEFLR